MLKQKPQDEAFADGVVKILRQVDTAEPGDMPVEKLKPVLTLRYRRRTVGVTRHYTALQNMQRVDEVIRCPAAREVLEDDIAILPEGRYIVRQVQYPEGTAIRVMDIALERVVEKGEAGSCESGAFGGVAEENVAF